MNYENWNTTYIIVYEDDRIIEGNKTEIIGIIKKLTSEYKIKKVEELRIPDTETGKVSRD